MLKKLYHWMLEKAAGPAAVPVLAAVAFVESSFFPLPPDLMLIPMCLAARRRAFMFALVCSLASVAGGLLGYGIGSLLYETAGRWILDFYGDADVLYARFQEAFQAQGFWLVAMAGFTPFPFKVITISSGVAGLNLPLFLLACFVSRAGRFFLEAALLYMFGEKIRSLIERYFGLLTVAFFLLLLGGFLAIKLFV